MDTDRRDRILVADHNPTFRETLVRRLRAAGYEVTTADTGEHAFLTLRDWQHPIEWLYTRAGLPILIDGWILADEYHDTYPARPAVIAAAKVRPSRQGDIILAHPSPASVLEIIRELIAARHDRPAAAAMGSGCQRQAA
ncbi:response regulator [Microvirga calopogonii]|uniref:response regulator n=1 Tax=Microvirga calopogonii TaxID=2078013 RepID=UPI0013B45E08|nr:response regulator [Microvirga calopogonii]